MTLRYVPIERTFRRVEPDQASGEVNYEVEAQMAWGGFGEGLTWDELLEHPRVVVLGEAGMGKTREFQHQAERLSADGRTAFFLRIEHLLEPSFADAFETPAEFESFETWSARESEAFFFLDSVDEARLNHPEALRKALQHFRRGLGGHLRRARLFLSCRASDWRYFQDPKELEQFLPVHAPSPSGEAPILVVQMRALNSAQFSQLAQALGLEDPQRLKDELEMAGAYAFVQRPQDVEWLVGYWQQHHKLGTLGQLTEHNIQQKLKEENPRRRAQDSLTVARAREGAEALAAGLVLCGKAELLVPEPGSPRTATVESDPRDFLPDWTDPQIAALLTRGIFDEATYGRVRFHHRSIREYLAACWLTGQRKGGWLRAEFVNLFTQEMVGRRVIVKPLRGVLGWVASMDARLQAETIQLSPELLLQEGDPEALTDESRRMLLRRLVERFADRQRVRLRPSRAMRRRFVSRALAPDIRQLLQERPKTEDIREFLLDLVADGGLEECAAIALELALDQDEALDVRVKAVHAVAVCGHAGQRSALVSWARQAKALPSELVEAMLRGLFPVELGIEDCVELLREMEMNAHVREVSLSYLLQQELPILCPPEELEDFLEALLRLIESSDGTEKYEWIPGAIAHVIIRILKTCPPRELPLDLLGQAFVERQVMLDAGKGRSSASKELSEALRPQQSVRRHLFWFVVSHRPDIPLWRYRERFCTGWEDVEWLLADAIREGSERAREVAVETVLFLWSRSSRLPGDRERMLQLAEGDPRIRVQLEEDTLPRSTPTTDLDAQRQAWEEQERGEREAWRQEALSRLAEISSGQDIETLYALMIRIDEDPKVIVLRHGQSHWKAIEQENGKEIADAGRSGCKRFWRTWTPPLPAELTHKDREKLEVGLSGLQTEIEEGFDLSMLSEDERVIAARYSLCEMMDFPEWLSQLVLRFPANTGEVFSEAVAAEFSQRKRLDMIRSLLVKLEDAAAPVSKVFVPVLQERLERDEPRLEQVLRESLRVLRRSPYTDGERLARLARRHVEQRGRVDEPGGLSWLIAWLSLDGGPAWDFVERWLQETPHQARKRLIQLAAAFETPPWPLELARVPSFYAPATLRRMILTLHRYLPAEARDEASEPSEWRAATEFRSHLCNSLAEAHGEEAQQELLALAEDPLLERSRDYFLYLADLQAEENTSLDPWTSQRFAEFARGERLASVAPRVFISYRQEDSAEMTGRIYDWLKRDLGDDAVFLDVYSIPGAADFMKKIEAAIPMGAVLLAIIGQRWLTPQVSDYVQRELEIAFQHGIPVVPVLIQGAKMPRPEQLPETLQGLCRLKAVEVRRDSGFPQDMDHLMDTVLRISRVGAS